MFDLKGKVAVVTGGSGGIGERISLRLAEAGAAVMIVDKQAADDTINQIKNNGGTAHAEIIDLSRCAEIEAAIDATIAVLGDIHILVNNAGIWPMTPFLDLTEETWDITQTVNLKASAFCSQAAAKAMIKAGHGGTIINIGSESAIRPPLGKTSTLCGGQRRNSLTDQSDCPGTATLRHQGQYGLPGFNHQRRRQQTHFRSTRPNGKAHPNTSLWAGWERLMILPGSSYLWPAALQIIS